MGDIELEGLAARDVEDGFGARVADGGALGPGEGGGAGDDEAFEEV